MSYPEKRTIVSIITGILILGAYVIYAYGKYQAGMTTAGDLKFWAGTILMVVGISIVTNIIIQIVFHILLSISLAVVEKVKDINFDEKLIEKSIENEMVTDEMDKLIELKSMRVGFIVAGIGFITALVSLMLNGSPVMMINILFVAFLIGSLIEGFTSLYFYRNGV